MTEILLTAFGIAVVLSGAALLSKMLAGDAPKVEPPSR